MTDKTLSEKNPRNIVITTNGFIREYDLDANLCRNETVSSWGLRRIKSLSRFDQGIDVPHAIAYYVGFKNSSRIHEAARNGTHLSLLGFGGEIIQTAVSSPFINTKHFETDDVINAVDIGQAHYTHEGYYEGWQY